MKALIIGCFDLYLHPYSEKYIAILKENQVDFKFIYWNRSNKPVPPEPFYIPFQYSMDTFTSIFHKIKGYIRFRKFVKNHLKKEKYDKIFFLTSQAMFLFGKIAQKKYFNNFLFDYRDVTYERIAFFKHLMIKNINASYFTVVSSLGFKDNFPNIPSKKFVLCHNIKNGFKKMEIEHISSPKKRINFWGVVRQPEYFKKIFKLFGNVNSIEVNIYGTGFCDEMERIIKRNNYSNIFVHGEYRQEDIPKFVSSTDFLLNCYSNKSIQKLALTVKLYEGIEYGVPMIIQKDSYMDNYLSNMNYAHISLDFDNIISQENINIDSILVKPDIVEDTIFNSIFYDQNIFYNKVIDFIRKK